MTLSLNQARMSAVKPSATLEMSKRAGELKRQGVDEAARLLWNWVHPAATDAAPAGEVADEEAAAATSDATDEAEQPSDDASADKAD